MEFLGVSLTDLEYTGRILIAAMLTGLIGLERERTGRDAGFRTIMLVGVGSALVTILSINAFGPGLRDPARVASQIVVGVGFLGAGALIRQGNRVRNMTTAATIWVAAALGMAVGSGWYWMATSTTVVIFVILTSLRRVERFLIPAQHLERHGSETNEPVHPQPNLGTSPRMGWLEDAPEKNYEPRSPEGS